MRLRRPVPFLVALIVPFVAACTGSDAGDATTPKVASSIEVVSGTGQTAAAASALSQPVVAEVTDQNGDAVANATVTWAATGGGHASAATTSTGPDGRTQVTWTLGTTAGAQALTASTGTLSAAAAATATPGAPVTFSVVGGSAQNGTVGSALAQPISAKVSDAYGNGIPGIAVTFTAAAGSGAVTSPVLTTNALGRAQTIWTLGTTAGAQSVSAAVPGLPDITFNATAAPALASAMSLTPIPATIATGDTVRASGGGTDTYGNATTLPAVVWSSSNPAVATVTSTGLIRGISTGSAQITATALAVVGLSATVNVNVSGPTVLPFNLDIAGVYVTQSTQTFAGAVPLVAGRDGLLRVFARANLANTDTPSIRVRIYQGATLVDTRIVNATLSSVPVSVNEGVLDASWNTYIFGHMIQPGMRILVDVDPANRIMEFNEGDNVFPSTGTPLALDVRTMAPLSARFVPVQQPNATTGDVTEANKATFTTLAAAMYPFAQIDADVRTPYSFDKVLPSSYDTIWNRLLFELEALRVSEGSQRFYYGVIKPDYASGGTGLGFVGNGGPTGRTAIGVDWSNWRAETVAHEWGHNFGRRHVACGGPSNPDPGYPYAGGTLGHYGWDRRTNTLRPLNASFDIMSYCQPYWVSDYTYNAVLTFNGGGAVTTARFAEPSLLLWGRTTPGGDVILEPAFEVTAPPSMPSAGGRFRIEATDAAGARLLDMSFDGMEIDHTGARAFTWVVPLSRLGGRDAATIRLTSGGRQAIQRRAPAAVAGGSAVMADEVRATRTAAGRVRLQWNAARNPVVLVRDARTGQVLSFARGGDRVITAPGAELDVQLSDGVHSSSRKVRVQQ
ncbi:MAG TPA: Ig-like domain-containing protein [Longimicrobiales bacterium]